MKIKRTFQLGESKSLEVALQTNRINNIAKCEFMYVKGFFNACSENNTKSILKLGKYEDMSILKS